MIHLNKRSQNILSYLLQYDKPISAEDLASALGITARMVRYSLRYVEEWLAERDISLICRTNFGILIDCAPSIKTKLISELEQPSEDKVLSSKERLHIIILTLLTEEEPLLIKQLMHRLHISRPTAIKDLRNSNCWLREHNLSLTSQSHVGFSVIGSEKDFREAIVSLLLDSSEKDLLLSICTGLGKPISNQVPGESDPIRKFLQALNLSYAKSLLDDAVVRLEIQASDHAYLSLLLHLAILIMRVNQKKMIEYSYQTLLNLNIKKELNEARIIEKNIQRYFKITLTESEVAFIAAQLYALGENITDNNENKIEWQVPRLVEGIISEAAIFLHPSLSKDQKLFEDLTKHFKELLFRLQFNLPVRNPLLDHIKRQFPYIFQVAQNSSSVLKIKTGFDVPKDEIGYITLYFGAAMERLRLNSINKKRVIIVCAEGIATAWLLVSRIRTEFPNLEIVRVSSLMEIQKNKGFRENIDAIISTIPLEIADINIITINPILEQKDILKLKEELELENTKVVPQPSDFQVEGDISLSDLITANTIRLKVKAENWLDVVDKASESLIANESIEPRYVEAMKTVIQTHGPYSVSWPGVVLLHARPEDGVRHLCMSLTTLETPVNFGHPENDPVDVALVLGTDDIHSHLRALMELTTLLADEKALTSIRQSEDRDETKLIISSISCKKEYI